MDVQGRVAELKPRHLMIIGALCVAVELLVVAPVPAPTSIPEMTAEPWGAVWVEPREPTGRAARPAPPIRVGSPIDGTWGNAGAPGSTPAGGHHLLAKTSPVNHWAVDLRASVGSPVLLYAAASDPADDAAVTTAITQIVDNDACRLGGGGDFVTVGIYFDGVLAGRVTYAHLERHPALQVGLAVPRWGTTLGTVASLRGRATGGPGCWTGPHVHLEMRAEIQQACWIRGRAPGRQVRRADSLGFASGPLLGPSAAPCP